MSSKKKLLWIVGGLGCAMLLLGGCIIALFGGSLLWAGKQLPTVTHNYDMIKRLGKKLDTKTLPECISPWQIDEKNKIAVCEQLTKPALFANDEPTNVTVNFDDERLVRYFTLRIPTPRYDHQPDPQLPATRETWFTLAPASLLKDNSCKPRYGIFPGATLVQCKNSAYGLAQLPGLLFDSNKDEPIEFYGHLWIGKNTKDFQEYYNHQGRRAAVLYYDYEKENANRALANGSDSILSADTHLIMANYYLMLAYHDMKRPAAITKQIKNIATTRKKIHPQVVSQHKANDSQSLLPKSNGIIDLRTLKNKSQSDIEALLGPPNQCKTMRTKSAGTFPRCIYGEEIWKAEISFINKRAHTINFTFRDQIVPFSEDILHKLEIYPRSPTKSTASTLQWANIDGLSELIVEKKKPHYTVVSAR